MKEINIINKVKYNNFEVPMIEGGFGINKRVVLIKTIGEIYDIKVSELNKFINKNKEKFKFSEDIFDIKEELINNDNLRLELNMTKREINKKRNKQKY